MFHTSYMYYKGINSCVSPCLNYFAPTDLYGMFQIKTWTILF